MKTGEHMSEIILNSGNFESEVLKSDKPVLVDFFATWCNPCKMTAPHVAKIAENYEGKIKVGVLDVDLSPDIAQNYNISSIPSILIFKNNNVVNRHIGSATYAFLDSIVRQVLANETTAQS